MLGGDVKSIEKSGRMWPLGNPLPTERLVPASKPLLDQRELYTLSPIEILLSMHHLVP